MTARRFSSCFACEPPRLRIVRASWRILDPEPIAGIALLLRTKQASERYAGLPRLGNGSVQPALVQLPLSPLRRRA